MIRWCRLTDAILIHLRISGPRRQPWHIWRMGDIVCWMINGLYERFYRAPSRTRWTFKVLYLGMREGGTGTWEKEGREGKAEDCGGLCAGECAPNP
jgi:hypothetical protein